MQLAQNSELIHVIKQTTSAKGIYVHQVYQRTLFFKLFEKDYTFVRVIREMEKYLSMGEQTSVNSC